MFRLHFKFLSTIVRQSETPSVAYSILIGRDRERKREKGNSCSHSGWDWAPGLAGGSCFPSRLTVSQLPVCLFREFPLTQSQQHMEINGTINGGDGKTNSSWHSQHQTPGKTILSGPRILGFSPITETSPMAVPQELGIINVQSRSKSMQSTDGLKNMYQLLLKVLGNIWYGFDTKI